MQKRLMFIAFVLLAICNKMVAANQADLITISDFSISSGQSKDVSIELTNSDTYVGFQFDLSLPQGFTVESYSADSNRIPEGTSLRMAQQSDGSYRFVAAALDGSPITGNSGAVVHITVKAADSAAEGEHTGYIRDTKLSKADGSGATITEQAFVITVKGPEAYAVMSSYSSSMTLTFYYDDQKTARNGVGVGPFTPDTNSEWYSIRENITSVVFDASFDNCRNLTSTAYWFNGCKNLTTISGIEYLHTDNVTDIRAMFGSCSSLTSIDLSHFNTESVTNFYGMFYDCTGLTSLDVTGFNTANATRMDNMFENCSGLTELDLHNFNTANVQNMSKMFLSCTGLTALDLSSFNTANVSNMTSMFSGCSALVTIYVGDGWSTAKAGSGSEMFYGCTSLVGGAGTTFSSSRIGATYAHIDGGSSNPGYFTRSGDAPYVAPEPYARLTGDRTTGITVTFYYNSNRTDSDKDIFSFEASTGYRWGTYASDIVSIVIDESFANYTGLTSVTNLLNNCPMLTSIEGLANLNTSAVTSMEDMFSGCGSLKTIDVSGLNTSNVTNMTYMFANCIGLTSLDLSSFNTSNLTTMEGLCYNCSSLSTIILPQSLRTIGKSAFSGCISLTSVHIPEGVMGIGEYAFMGAGLTSVDLPEGLESIGSNAFRDNPLTEITIPANVGGIGGEAFEGATTTVTKVTSLSQNPAQFESGDHVFASYVYSNVPLYVPTGTIQTYKAIDGWAAFQDIREIGSSDQPETYAVLSEANSSPASHRAATAQPMVLTFYYDTKKAERGGMDIGPFTNLEERPWHEMAERIENIIFDSAVTNDTTITSTAYWFYEFSNLKNIDGLQWLNTKNVTDMSSMFSFCSAINWINVSNFNTSKLTNMDFMFIGCSALTSLDLSNFNTTNVTSMHNMFMGCSSLTNLDLSNFNTTNVTGMNAMFFDCSSLTNLDLSNFNTANATEMLSMFMNCSSLTTIYAGSGWTTTAETMGKDMFKYCTHLVGGKGTVYDSLHVDHTYARIDGGPDNPGYLTNINDSGTFAVTLVTGQGGAMDYVVMTVENEEKSTGSVATESQTVVRVPAQGKVQLTMKPANGYHLQSLMINNDDVTASVENNIYTLAGINGTFTITASFVENSMEPYAVLSENNTILTFYYDKQKAERNGMSVGPHSDFRAREWYDAIDRITTVVFDDSFADYGNLTSTYDWFLDCTNLSKVEGISNLRTDSVTDMTGMFGGCSSLTSLDVSHFNTAKVVGMYGMFSGCTGLTTLDVSSFNTSSVTDMRYMFYACSGLTELDLSSFNTINVTSMDNIFADCSNLKTIYVSDGWTTANVISSGNMFIGCSNLVGGKGTTYNPNYLQDTYAHIDGGASNPGYFTDKNAPADDSDIIQFADAAVKAICVQNWDTNGDGELSMNEAAAVTTLGGVFGNNQEITSFDEFQYFTGVTAIRGGEFTLCSNLKSIVFPASVTTIGSQAFQETGFTEFTIPNTITTIEEYAFSGNIQLKSIMIPASVISIGKEAFMIYALERIEVDPNNRVYDSRDNCNAIVETATNKLIQACKTSTIPSSIEAIGENAFYWMEWTSITIPASVRSIEEYAFNSSYYTSAAPKEIICEVETPFEINSNVFWEEDYTKATLYVPESSIEAYRNTPAWSQFQNILPIGGTFGQDRMLVAWRQVGGKQYRLYKAVDKTSVHTNADGWNMYRTALTLDVVSGSDTLKVMVDNGTLYTEEPTYNNSIKPCLLIDVENDMMYVFSNSKDNNGGYSMDGYAYRSSLSQPHFERETVFLQRNDGWFSYFTGVENGQPVLSHFSYAGYFDMLSRRGNDGTWTTESVGDISPDAANTRWKGVQKITVSGSRYEDESALDGFTYTLVDDNHVWLSWVNDKTIAPDMTIPSAIDVNGRHMTVTGIAPYTFFDCNQLETMIIPSSVEWIGESALVWCGRLKSLTVEREVPPMLASETGNKTQFEGIDTTTCILYVPAGSVQSYRNTSGWNMFQNIVEMDATIDYTFDYNGVLTVRGETTMADALSAAGGTEEVAKTITAVVWAKGTPLTNSDLQGLDNPNMLVYVADASLAPSNRDNVVIGNDSTGYLAKNIMLTDVESGNNNFFCPQEFTAEMISYTRNFRQQTEVGVSRGWETIALPFQVQTIMHEKNGLLAPFGNTSSDKHFWLRQIAMDGATTGLSAATQILPNTPYLISMPNSEEYPAEYNQNGRVTFSSQNVRVPNTEPSYAQTNIPGVGVVMFVPTFSAQTANNHIYALNVLEQRGEHKEGSIFEANYRTVRPFEAYTYHEDGQRPAPRYISIGDINSGTTGIESLTPSLSKGEGAWYTIDGRRLQQKPTQKGVYILNGRKTIVK